LRYIRNPESAFTPKRKSLVNLTPTLPSQITENLKEDRRRQKKTEEDRREESESGDEGARCRDCFERNKVKKETRGQVI